MFGAGIKIKLDLTCFIIQRDLDVRDVSKGDEGCV